MGCAAPIRGIPFNNDYEPLFFQEGGSPVEWIFPVSDAARMLGIILFYQFGFLVSTGVIPYCGVPGEVLYGGDALRLASCRGIRFVLGSVPGSPPGSDTRPLTLSFAWRAMRLPLNIPSLDVDAVPCVPPVTGVSWRETWCGHSHGRLIPSDENQQPAQRGGAAQVYPDRVADRGNLGRSLPVYSLSEAETEAPITNIMSVARRPPPWNRSFLQGSLASKTKSLVAQPISENIQPNERSIRPYVYSGYNFQRTSQAYISG
jgi:hypothetical protein